MRILAAAVLLAAAPGALVAQGFMVNEHSACVMARAGTGVSAPCADGSAITYNPAGIAGSQGLTFSGGVVGIKALGSFTTDYTGLSTNLQNGWIPVPHVYATYGVTPKLTAGLGFFVPYGLGTKWPTTFEGRFNGYDNSVQSMYFQPTLAYKVNDLLSVGAGFDFVIGSVKLHQRADFSEQAVSLSPLIYAGQIGIPYHTDFADVSLSASGATGVGGNFGILITPGPGVSLGFRYLARVKLNYTGDVVFTPVQTGIVIPADLSLGGQTIPAGTPLDYLINTELDLFGSNGPLQNQTAKTSLTMPDQLSAGVSVAPSDAVRFLAEWQWVHWAVFDSLPIDFSVAPDRSVKESYQNTNGFRIGAEWMTTNRVTLRGGYLYHEGAAPPQSVTPLLPEGSRNEITAGLGVKLTNQFTLDVAYQYIMQNDRRGRVRDAPPGEDPTVALNSGLYTFKAHLLATTLTVHF